MVNLKFFGIKLDKHSINRRAMNSRTVEARWNKYYAKLDPAKRLDWDKEFERQNNEMIKISRELDQADY